MGKISKQKLMSDELYHEIQDELSLMPDLKKRTTIVSTETKKKILYFMRAGVSTDQCLCRKFGIDNSVLVPIRKEMVNNE